VALLATLPCRGRPTDLRRSRQNAENMAQDTFDPETLPHQWSHILIEVPAGGLRFDPRGYLHGKGVQVEKETICTDDDGRTWLILSLAMSDIGKLILELIEKGLSGNIRGIDLKT
jgi:hypothetical protein